MAILDDVKQNFLEYMVSVNPGSYPNQAAAQATIDMYQSIVDPLDHDTLVMYNQLYLPMVFTGTESTYQSTYDGLPAKSDQELRDSLMVLILYYTIKTSAPTVVDPRTSLTMMERLTLQATVPTDADLLSKSKIIISDPDSSKWPYSTPGTDFEGQPVVSGFSTFYQNWRGATAPQVQTIYDYTDSTNSTPELPSMSSAAIAAQSRWLGPILGFDDWLPMNKDQANNYSNYNLKSNISTGSNSTTDYTYADAVTNASGYTSFSGGFTNTIGIETDETVIPSQYIDPTDSQRQIFAGQGAVPYQIAEMRTVSGPKITVINETSDPVNPPPTALEAYQSTSYYDADDWFVSVPNYSFWVWTRMISLISKEQWPEIVTVMLKDPTTGDIIVERNMPAISNQIRMNATGDATWIVQIRDLDYAYDFTRWRAPNSSGYEQPFWFKDPWIDDPYVLLPESGLNEYILEIRKPVDETPAMPASNSIDISYTWPIVDIDFFVDREKNISDVSLQTGTTSLFKDIEISYIYNGIASGAFANITAALASMNAIKNSIGPVSSATVVQMRLDAIAKLNSNGFNALPDYATAVNYINNDSSWNAPYNYYRGLLIYEAQLGFV